MKHLFLFITLCFVQCSAPLLEALTVEEVPIIPYKKNKPTGKGEVAVCAIFNNEASYLKEWIEYHRIVGVSHFFLYNNSSSDHYLAVLKPYIADGIIELYDVPIDCEQFVDGPISFNFVQTCCYNHAINLAKKHYKWIAVIDSDEFIFPVSSVTLTECLRKYDRVSGLIVFWQIYGTSDVWELKPGELMLEKLLYKFPTNYRENWLFKSIVRPEHAVCQDQHWTKTPSQVYPNRVRFTHFPNFKELPIDQIRINHYSFRTGSFFENVKKKRYQRWGYNWSDEEQRERMNLANSVYDPVMLKFMPALRKKVFKD